MLTLIGLFTAGCVVLLTISLVLLAPRRPAAVGKRLDELRALGGRDEIERRRREANAERLKNVLAVLGGRVGESRSDSSAVRHFLVQAGYADASAVQIYWAARIITPAVLLIAALAVGKAIHATPSKMLLGILWALGVGWIGPTFFVRSRLKRRQKEVQLALPDMLDLLVVCVEAGLGLNQALTRVADEIHHVSPVTSEQLTLVNLEMRAGTPREPRGVPAGPRAPGALLADRAGERIDLGQRRHVGRSRVHHSPRPAIRREKVRFRSGARWPSFIFPAQSRRCRQP